MSDSRGVRVMGTEFLEITGGRLAYEVIGPQDGPLVVCAHGMGDTRKVFRFLAPRLAEAGYRVAAVDVRGHGESSTGWPDYSPRSVGSDLLALVRHLGGPAVLVGSSSSAGAVAWTTATAAEGEVSAVVMLAPFVGRPQLGLMLRLAQNLVMASPLLWGMYYRSLYPTAKPADLPGYLRELRATLREPGRMAAVSGVVAPAEGHWTDCAPRMTCPALVVMGSKDPDFPDPAAEARLAEEVLRPYAATTGVAMIEGAGHYPHAELPEATFAALEGFLAGAARA
ncbi:alpha/beta hydrolase [Streptosporangium sp. NPDC002524]|uniref:alpha/beta fold hydrolase n=1 Tax=Streptosporangium sp. NPDC002524 TaxID=3154537 RepID=UPI00332E9F22